jgi:undecaprenyl-diphosphatase
MANIDEQLLRAARTWGHGPRVERVVARFSKLGEHGALWLAFGAAGGALDAPRRAEWRRATRTVAGTYALNMLLKRFVRRRRPCLPDLPPLAGTPTQLSFPSAHASTSFAGARCYSRLGLPAAPLYALAAGLAYSRLYLGVHYPSDVLGGALLGSAVAAGAMDMPGPALYAPSPDRRSGAHRRGAGAHTRGRTPMTTPQ